MPRITCKTPSTGRPVGFYVAGLTNVFTTILEAPDFSTPDPSNVWPNRDPLDSARAIRPGEMFLVRPILCRNTSLTERWVEFQLLREGGVVISFFRVVVPALDTVEVPVQGLSLFKRVPGGANGDRLQARAQVNPLFDVWGAAEERLAAEHIGVV
ncbi:MAG: hypothetical protein K2X74_00520 [Acetobacteraceae bacterium]|nr:hypothetical protein [Acetobacteraceae bacterium]